MVFITTEDDRFLTTESGVFLTIDLAVLVEVRKEYFAISRLANFVAVPRMDEFELTGD